MAFTPCTEDDLNEALAEPKCLAYAHGVGWSLEIAYVAGIETYTVLKNEQAVLVTENRFEARAKYNDLGAQTHG